MKQTRTDVDYNNDTGQNLPFVNWFWPDNGIDIAVYQP